MKLARILVVDDEAVVRRNVEKMLTKAGYEVITASNSEAALEAVESQKFDLVVLDIAMPDWTGRLSGRAGVEVLKRIKSLQPYLPVVMLTASVTIELAIESMKHGACDYIVKGSMGSHAFLREVQKNLTPGNIPKKKADDRPNGRGSKMSNFSGMGGWLVARTGGALDEIVAALIMSGVLYLVGRVSGVLQDTSRLLAGDPASLLYLLVSTVVVVSVLFAYLWWQRKWK